MLSKGAWAREMLRRLAENASRHPAPTSETAGLGHTFNFAVSQPECLELINLPCELVRRDEIRLLFQRLESRIKTDTPWTQQTRKRYFAYFRASVLLATQELPFPEQITNDSLRYRTTIARKSEPRKLISDLVDESADAPELTEPLGAVSHETTAELYTKTQAKVECDLARIIEACVIELKFWGRVRQKVGELSKIPPTSIEKTILENLLRSEGMYSKWSFEQANDEFTPERRVGLYAQFARENGVMKSTSGSGFTFPGLKKALTDWLRVDEKQWLGERPRRVLVTPYRMLSSELIAAFILLLCHTGWNSNSLINMPAAMIKEDGCNVEVLLRKAEIQGFKSKTDDDTPMVFLDNTHRYALEALNLILWNLRQLKLLGLVSPDEQRLWFTFTTGGAEKLTEQYIGFQNALSNFIRKHTLPKFSLDQIRTQVLVAQQLRFRNLDATRRVAGHVNLSTTGRYLEQEIFNRINSSVNLEFQRRLEATVHFRMLEVGDSVVPSFEKTRIDKELLVPIGDGTSCESPSRPPFKDYLDGEICSAQMCHSGSGCSNRRIIIDANRVEEIVRTRNYYARRWKGLLENNPESFEINHFDKMVFNLALYDYVKNSLYVAVLKKIEASLEN
jgi:hypothetical protein